MQSKLESHVETAFDLAIGFCLAWLITYYISPYFALTTAKGSFYWIVLFTTVSYTRRYLTRRLFNRLNYRGNL